MSALQHIVAAKASDICNDAALTAFFPRRHNVAMPDESPSPRPNYLRKWREHRKLSQVELAEMVGTSHQVIGYLERGRTQLSAKWLRRLSEALNTTPGHLLDIDPEDTDNEIVEIWSRIPERDRANAVKALRGYMKTGTDD